MGMDSKKSRAVISFRQALFWDVDPRTIDPEKHAQYVIERILEFGNDEEVRWMWSYYTSERIRDVVENRRGLRAAVKPLWQALTSKAQ